MMNRCGLVSPRTRQHPPTTLSELSRVADDAVRFAVAGNPSTPSDTLRELSTDAYRGVRFQVVGNPSTPVDTLRERLRFPFSGDTLWIFEVLDRNPSWPVDTESLGSHESRQRVAGYPSTPVDTLTKLSHDAGVSVREAVASNASTRLRSSAKAPKQTYAVVLLRTRERPRRCLGSSVTTLKRACAPVLRATRQHPLERSGTSTTTLD